MRGGRIMKNSAHFDRYFIDELCLRMVGGFPLCTFSSISSLLARLGSDTTLMEIEHPFVYTLLYTERSAL